MGELWVVSVYMRNIELHYLQGGEGGKFSSGFGGGGGLRTFDRGPGDGGGYTGGSGEASDDISCEGGGDLLMMEQINKMNVAIIALVLVG